ncbi:DNA-binding transcriptional MerR regulator [Amycolatopsis thermoflava]|uniref:DNA-binding transcriptional MerR regulator n=1 Tax=Amycolatopsis thermoflava TaxID=84480 RepID=A0A3N2GUK3_9PSEU|nr:DNA-binding transcriptional MerR regulator [Amycolatopsis thermoflava]
MPVAAVARRLGVAPSTLRTWDRRYGLGPSRHTDGKHRRYCAADIGRLELMQRALLRGASTAEAARYALQQMPKSFGAAPEIAAQPLPPPAEQLSAAQNGAAARRLRAAAVALDGRAVQQTLDDAIGSAGVLDAWEGVIAPVLDACGAGWPGTPAGVEVQAMLSECVLAAVVRATPVLDHPRNQRPVLLSRVPDEQDALSLHVLAAGLAARRIGSQLFGLPLPGPALSAAVRRSSPAAVVLWADRAGNADPELFPEVSRGGLRSRLFAAGPGWRAPELPDRVEQLSGLRTAADRIEYVLVGK